MTNLTDERKKEILESFKRFVDTYKERMFLTEEGFIEDMVYGIGTSLNEKKYRCADGYKLFRERLLKLFQERYGG